MVSGNTTRIHFDPTQPWSTRMALSVMQRNVPFRWHYEHGLALLAIEQVWQKTADPRFFEYVFKTFDPFIYPDGTIRDYSVQEYNLDQINPGRLLFPLYRADGNEKYKKAAHLLLEQLNTQPRTHDRGYWHKKIYPYQMWLDGIYMASPFHAEFGETFGEPAVFDDVVMQIILMEQHARDAHSGLLYHGWDESKQMPWANPETGCSPHFWGRAVGWYAMAIVDVLDYLPQEHPGRAAVIAIFQRLAAAVARVQDPAQGVWYQILNLGGRPGNYLEASASCMFVCALAKAVRQGIVPAHYLKVARAGYQGILANFIRVDEGGLVNLDKICSVGGLGGVPYRDGSFEYYIGEKISTNDYKGVGPFILASLEMERL